MEWNENVTHLQRCAVIGLDEAIYNMEQALKSLKAARSLIWQSWDAAKVITSKPVVADNEKPQAG